MTAARKAQDKPLTLLLGTTISELKNRRIEIQRDLTDEDVHEVLRKSIKRRKESVEAYTKAAREDLAGREREEAELLQRYLPADVPDEEIRSIVREAVAGGANNIGAVMGKVMPRLKGRADGSRINAIVREELSHQG